MDGCLLAGCGAFFVIFVVLGWLLLHRRRKPQLRRSLVISECLQPQMQCKPVPCQHPYYRVISEYSEKPKKDHTQKENSEKIYQPECHKTRNSISIQCVQPNLNSITSSMTEQEKTVEMS